MNWVNAMPFKSFSLKSFPFKSAQRFHFAGQRQLVEPRSPLGHFRPALAQTVPLGWATQSFEQHVASPLLTSLGQRSPLFLPERRSPNEVALAPRATDETNTPVTDRSIQPTLDAADRQSIESPNPPAIQRRPTIPTSTPEPLVRSPQEIALSAEPQPDRSPAGSPSIPQPKEAESFRSEKQKPNTEATSIDRLDLADSPTKPTEAAFGDQQNADHNTVSKPAESIQRQSDQLAQDNDSPTHPQSVQQANETHASTPNISATTVQPRLDSDTTVEAATAAIAPPSQQAIATSQEQPPLQRTAVPHAQPEETEPVISDRVQRREIASTAAPPTARTKVASEFNQREQSTAANNQSATTQNPQFSTADAIAQPRLESDQTPVIQARLDSETATVQSQPPSIAAIVESGQPPLIQPQLDLAAAAVQNQSFSTAASTSHSSEVASPASTTVDPLSKQIQPTVSIDRLNPSPIESPIASLISPRSDHHHTILLKPLGFTKSLMRKAEPTALQPDFEPSDRSSDSTPPNAAFTNSLQRKAEASAPSLRSPSLPEDKNSTAQSQSRPSIAPALPLPPIDATLTAPAPIQQRIAPPDRSIAPNPEGNTAQSVPDAWLDLTELLDGNLSRNPSFSSANPSPDPAFSSDRGELITLASPGSTPANPTPTDRSVSLRSPLSPDRATPPKTLEQQLEAIAYPVYQLLRQQWHIEQRGKLRSRYPDWSSTIRLGDRATSSHPTAHHSAILEPPDPGSPLHRKMQLLTQQVYGLVHWQLAIEQERNGFNTTGKEAIWF